MRLFRSFLFLSDLFFFLLSLLVHQICPYFSISFNLFFVILSLFILSLFILSLFILSLFLHYCYYIGRFAQVLVILLFDTQAYVARNIAFLAGVPFLHISIPKLASGTMSIFCRLSVRYNVRVLVCCTEHDIVPLYVRRRDIVSMIFCYNLCNLAKFRRDIHP